MRKVVVSDTGPLISLEKLISGYQFAQKIFSEIIIPKAVESEICKDFGSLEAYERNFNISGFLTVESNIPEPDFSIYKLHLGEIEALSIARATSLPLLIEEKAGRKMAVSLNISISGVIGQVVGAHTSHIISLEESLSFAIQLRAHGRISKPLFKGAIERLAKLNNIVIIAACLMAYKIYHDELSSVLESAPMSRVVQEEIDEFLS